MNLVIVLLTELLYTFTTFKTFKLTSGVFTPPLTGTLIFFFFFF